MMPAPKRVAPKGRLARAMFAMFAMALAAFTGSCGFLPLSKMSFVGTEVLEAAPKPAPRDSVFDGCGDAGSQPDYVLNRLKNRVDEGKYLPVSWKLIAQLPWPRRIGYRFRNQWTEGETKEVKRFEGVAVEVQGHLVAYKLEIPEPPNCYSRSDKLRDYHLWLSEHDHGSESNSIVVELTPRVRVSHPAWDDAHLAALVGNQARVRVRGWLMLDQMHPENVGRNRATLWEVHPTLRLDWRAAGGKWIPLDSLSVNTDTGRVQGRSAPARPPKHEPD